MSDPYRIEGPATISVSGGRTSGMMFKRIIDAHDGELPPNVHAIFANTGKERPETLRFVHDMETHWGVRIRWIEFVTDLRGVGAAGRFEEVGFNSASRAGEPFERLIARKTGALPNGRQRFCTEFLKVKAIFDFAEAEGLGHPGDFTEVIGLRADEAHRIARMRKDARNEASHLAFPLSTAGVRKSDVFEFWHEQPFDLQLKRGLGNCDQCPLVGDASRIARAQHDPAGVEWWARQEIERGYRFGRNFTMMEILGLAASSPRLPMDDDTDSECGTWCPSTMGGIA